MTLTRVQWLVGEILLCVTQRENKYTLFIKLNKTSFPYFRVKLSCVCLMIAYRKKLPKVTQR